MEESGSYVTEVVAFMNELYTERDCWMHSGSVERSFQKIQYCGYLVETQSKAIISLVDANYLLKQCRGAGACLLI